MVFTVKPHESMRATWRKNWKYLSQNAIDRHCTESSVRKLWISVLSDSCQWQKFFVPSESLWNKCNFAFLIPTLFACKCSSECAPYLKQKCWVAVSTKNVSFSLRFLILGSSDSSCHKFTHIFLSPVSGSTPAVFLRLWWKHDDPHRPFRLHINSLLQWFNLVLQRGFVISPAGNGRISEIRCNRGCQGRDTNLYSDVGPRRLRLYQIGRERIYLRNVFCATRRHVWQNNCGNNDVTKANAVYI